MIRKSSVFSMMVIGVMMFALLKMPSNTVSAAGKPPTKTPTPVGPTPTAAAPTATPGTWSPWWMANEWHTNSQSI
jgi:hypothetical protein